MEKDSLFKRMSEVSKDKLEFSALGKSQKTAAVIIAGVVFVLMVFFMHGGEKIEKKPSASQSRESKERDANALLKNLAYLRQLEKKKQALSEQPSPLKISKNQPGYQMSPKELLTRMKAPSTFFESSPGSFHTKKQIATDENVAEASFSGSGANESFANSQPKTSTVEAWMIPHPDYTIVSGEMLHATLNVASNSDLPGMVSAIIESPAYSYTGHRELIPSGSRLIGQYSSGVLQGQIRIFMMWNRLVLPSGVSVDISSPGTDEIGRSGSGADYVNRHFWSRFGESMLISMLSAGVANVGVSSEDSYNSAQEYRMAIAESFQQTANEMLQQNMLKAPTLVKYQGAKINVFIARDLSFYNVLSSVHVSQNYGYSK